MRPILEGVRVLDVGSFVFGPAAATVMADFGADVVKVEPPETGDPYRYLHQMPPLPKCEEDYCWLLTGRGKRSVALDLKDAEAREILLRLVREADVFVTNYPVRVLDGLRLAWRDLEPLNPRLVYAHATGFGEEGPEAEKPGYDATAWWARSGLQDAVRPRGGMPALSVPGMGDHPSAMALFGAIMLALYQRERTGRGGKVRSSLLANGAWSNGIYLQAMLCGAESFRHVDCREPDNALVNQYETGDGEWMLLALVQEDKLWPGLCRALERPDLLADPRFAIPRRSPRAREGALRDRRADPREPRLRPLAQGPRRAGRHLHPHGAAREPRARPAARGRRHPARGARLARPRGPEHREPDRRRRLRAARDAARAERRAAHRRGAGRARLRRGRPRGAPLPRRDPLRAR